MKWIKLLRQGRPQARQRVESVVDTTLKQTRFAFVAFFVLGFFTNILALTIPIYMLQVIDRVVRSQNYDTLLYLTLIAGVAVFVAALLAYFRTVLQNRIGSWMEERLFLEAVGSAFIRTESGRPGGDQIVRDLNTLRMYIGGQALATLFDAPWMPLFLMVLYILNPYVGLLATFFAAILLLLAFLNHRLTRKSQEEGNQAQSATMNLVGGALRQRSIFVSMGMLMPLMGRLSDSREKARSHQDRSADTTAKIQSLSRFLRQLAQILVLCTGAYMVTKGDITTGTMIACAILLGVALRPVDQSIGAWTGTVNALSARQRLRNFLLSEYPDTPQEDDLTGNIEVNKLLFIPPGQSGPLIRQVSFSVSAGEVLGILGPVGCGKSILAELMTGALTPTGGYVQLDGVDVSKRVLGPGGARIGYQDQNASLLPGTIAENITRFAPSSDLNTEHELNKAARLAGIDKAISGMPNGFATRLDNASPLLSRGQRQQIVLARAFFGTPALLVLDEPTAYLDRDGEDTLVNTLEFFKTEGSTMVIVTQNKRLLNLCDRVMLMRDGMAVVDTPATIQQRLKRSNTPNIAEARKPKALQ